MSASEIEMDPEVQITEEEDYPEESIDYLRQRMREAIENLDFQLASEYQRQIDEYSQDTSCDKIDNYRDKLITALTACAESSASKRKKIIKKFHTNELNERIKMDSALDDIKSRHMKELKDFEERLFLVYKDAMTKPISQHDDLIERAKLAALRCDFAQAQDYQAEAAAIKTKEQSAREESFEKMYKMKLKALLDKQRSEITSLESTYTVSISRIESTRMNALKEHTIAFKREMAKEYKRVVDSITKQRYDPKKPNSAPIDRKVIPGLLNDLEDEYKIQLVKYGLESGTVTMKPQLIAPNIRPESQMSLRMQSRVENRERERERRTTSRQASRSRTASRKNNY